MLNRAREQFYKLSQWTKKRVRSWLFDEEYYIGADYGYHDSTIVIIRRDKATGQITMIGDYNTKQAYQKDFLMKLSHFVKTYNVPNGNVVRDFPRGNLF